MALSQSRTHPPMSSIDVYKENWSMTKELISANHHLANYVYPGEYYRTPLIRLIHLPSCYLDVQTWSAERLAQEVRFLMQKNANPFETTASGLTCLHYAIEYAHVEDVLAILRALFEEMTAENARLLCNTAVTMEINLMPLDFVNHERVRDYLISMGADETRSWVRTKPGASMDR
jgi:hypothetical protein